VDEGTILPQKLVLRTARAENTKLAETPVVSVPALSQVEGFSVAKNNPCQSVVNFLVLFRGQTLGVLCGNEICG
jgi:hypothetical protein